MATCETTPYKCSENCLMIPSLVHFRLFPLLGAVFGFVAADVRAKLNIMHKHRHSNTGPHYITVDSMVDFETTSGLTKMKGSPPSGARTLLRLHRALEFIIAFLRGIRSLEAGNKLSGVAAEAYNSTLSAYHPWLIRKGIMLAVYTLPTKHELAGRMGMTDEDEYNNVLDHLCGSTQTVYDKIQTIYKQYDLLDLP